MAYKRIDLNADVGEGYGVYTLGDDAALMGAVTSVNVACGFHAGNAAIMHRCVTLAKDLDVALGAHPGFADREGFGRRALEMSETDLEYTIAYQIGALQALARYGGGPVGHVKLHGALYNAAAKNTRYASAAARALMAVQPQLILVGPSASELERAAGLHGLSYVREAFCDRRYDDDGSLVPRGHPDAIISSPADAAAQAVRLVMDGEVVSVSGKRLRVDSQTVCIHGDAPSAVAVAHAVRDALERAGIEIAPFFTHSERCA